MIVKQFVAVLCLGMMLGSCGAVSGLVSDHWPHMAGGLPNGVPPRPGAPGYDEFIAHQQSAQSGAADGTTTVTDQKPVAAGTKPVAVDTAANARATPAGARLPNDSNVGQGGLY